jgi:hypothetical protein
MVDKNMMQENKMGQSTPCAQREEQVYQNKEQVYLRNGVRQGDPNKNARRCGARTKSAGLPCRGMAIRGKTRCRLHGGLSTGAKTQEGKARSQKGNWKHGEYSMEFIKNIKILNKICRDFL